MGFETLWRRAAGSQRAAQVDGFSAVRRDIEEMFVQERQYRRDSYDINGKYGSDEGGDFLSVSSDEGYWDPIIVKLYQDGKALWRSNYADSPEWSDDFSNTSKNEVFHAAKVLEILRSHQERFFPSVKAGYPAVEKS